MLSVSDIERIDRAAKDLLENPGVKIDDEEIVRRLLSSGAKPGASSLVVRFPEKMVREYLSLAPESFFLADRAGGKRELSPDNPSCFWTGAALFYLDRKGLRLIEKKDLADFSRIVETLSGVDVIVGTSTEDTPPPHRDFVGFRIMAANTRKHLRALSFTAKGGEAMIEMAKVLSGEKGLKENPIFGIGFTAHGPLRWTSLALGVFKATSGYGIPCTINGEPMAGASAPVTLAGTAAVGTAEILSGIVVNQILEPGRPCFFNLGFSHVMDMRKGFAVTGGPENALLAVAGADLARYYRMPSVSWMCTDSLLYDGQNALEKMLACMTHAQARVSSVWGVGSVESEKTLSPVQAVIDNEIIGMVKRYLAGFIVDDESIALDEIRRVGISGEFMSSEHTLAHFRGAIFEPRILVRTQRSQKDEGEDMVRKAEKAVEQVLASEREPILEPEVERELLKIEKRYSELV
jgi:trimethylamine---corrinoid protein Co-methyltransferase